MVMWTAKSQSDNANLADLIAFEIEFNHISIVRIRIRNTYHVIDYAVPISGF